jgi:hypothetical protein
MSITSIFALLLPVINIQTSIKSIIIKLIILKLNVAKSVHAEAMPHLKFIFTRAVIKPVKKWLNSMETEDVRMFNAILSYSWSSLLMSDINLNACTLTLRRSCARFRRRSSS